VLPICYRRREPGAPRGELEHFLGTQYIDVIIQGEIALNEASHFLSAHFQLLPDEMNGEIKALSMGSLCTGDDAAVVFKPRDSITRIPHFELQLCD
jgi:hypothetical protein